MKLNYDNGCQVLSGIIILLHYTIPTEETSMQYAVTLPNMNYDLRTLVELARDAEASGWDGVFVWDCINMDDKATHDPWVMMSAIAATTQRVRIGPMITPLSRRRPWKLARETVTLDHLSHGRVVLPVGLGETNDGGFKNVGEALERKTRAKMLDESLDILTGLWSGQPFSYDGEHYHVQEMTFMPQPVQSPRIPIWVVGAWPRKKSLARALRYDGILPAKMNEDSSFADMTPDDIRELCAYIDEHRPPSASSTRYDIVYEGETPGDDAVRAADIVQPLAEAGVTWWLEAVWSKPETEGGAEGMRRRIRQGPPRVG
ncbi:MAG TPA: LLM class flavin-dependent oxidoreductase [Ktedonobacteraceae bacterium]|nr:LLM class flavin-dependent oxidoreductase [Ktedonobacteraceae bacterium]